MRSILTLFALILFCGTLHAQTQNNSIELKLERFAVKRSTGFGVQMIGMIVASGGYLLRHETNNEKYLYAAGAGLFIMGWGIQFGAGKELRK